MTTSERGVSDLVGGIQIALCLPFLHPFHSDSVGVPGLDQSPDWRHWFCRATRAELDRIFDYSNFFVPSVRRLLFPELEGWQGREEQAPSFDSDSTARVVRDAFGDGQTAKRFAESATRLTWVSCRPWLRSGLKMEIEGGRETTFTIDWVDALLLPQHVGTLIIRITVPGELPVDHAATFIRLIKKRVFRRRLSVPLASFTLPGGATTDWTSILEELLKDMSSAEAKWGGAAIAETFGTNFRYISLVGTPGRGVAREPFDSWQEEVAFALATGHAGTSDVDYYSPQGMTDLRRNAMLNSWENWRVIAYDGCISIAMLNGSGRRDQRIDTFTEIAEWAFTPLQALLVAQQVRLHQLATRVQRTPTDLHNAVAHLNSIELELVTFRRILWHEQITHAPIGTRLHALLRQDMRLSELSDFLQEELAIVKSRVDSESDEAQSRATKHTAALVEFLTVIGVPVGLYVALVQPLLNDWIRDQVQHFPNLPMVLLGGLVVVLTAAYTAIRWKGRRQR